MLLDIVNQIINAVGLSPQSTAGTPEGTARDFSNGKISTGALVNVGANSGTVTVAIQESADGSTNWATISGMSVAVPTGSANTITALRGQRTHRYVRAIVSANTGTALVSVTLHAEKQLSGTGGGYSRSPST